MPGTKADTRQPPTPPALSEAWAIVEDYVRRHGYSGLCNPAAGCGCGLDDFSPCGEMGMECRPAYRQKTPCVLCHRAGTAECDQEGFDVVYCPVGP